MLILEKPIEGFDLLGRSISKNSLALSIKTENNIRFLSDYLALGCFI